MSEEHQSFIKTPRQLITVVVLAFVVPVLVIALLTKYVGTGARTGAGSGGTSPEAIEARIQPVAKFVLQAGGAAAANHTGEEVYKTQCSACHAVGAAGAPKFQDSAAWAPRIKTGFDALLNSATKGKGNMPPQVGGAFQPIEIARAIVYMANAAGANFPEPKAPAEAPAGDKAAAAAPAAPSKPAGKK